LDIFPENVDEKCWEDYKRHDENNIPKSQRESVSTGRVATPLQVNEASNHHLEESLEENSQ
jgi:hypothetical protein